MAGKAFTEAMFRQNRLWAKEMTKHTPDFFTKHLAGQAPKMLWIGCADSRVQAENLQGTIADVFVHRNVANQYYNTDLNSLSVLQFFVEGLPEPKTKHVVVCGHYNCGGVNAAMNLDSRNGTVDNWVRPIRAAAIVRAKELATLRDDQDRWDAMCELNVVMSVDRVCNSVVIQDAWKNDKDIWVHGWIYGLKDGHLTDLCITARRNEDIVVPDKVSFAEIRKRMSNVVDHEFLQKE